MVVINVKSQFVTLFITVVTALAELSLTTAVLSLYSLCECRKLENGKSLYIRKHQRTTSMVTAACLAVFVIIELVVGATIEDEVSQIPFTEPCVQVGINTDQAFASIEQPTRSYLGQTSCVRFKDSHLQVFLSNSSLSSNAVACSEEAVYEVHSRDRPRRPTLEAKLYCGVDGFGLKWCSFTKLKDSIFSFTRVLGERESPGNESDFIDVRLFFQPASQDIVSHRLLKAILNESASNLDAVIGRVFLCSKSSTCTFFRPQDATQVPAAIIFVFVSVWSGSFLLYICLAYYGKHVLFDLSKPLDWAKVTLPSKGDSVRNVGNAKVSAEIEGDARRFFVQLLPKLNKKN